MPRRHPLIYVLQGPKPWWSPMALMAGSFFSMVAYNELLPPLPRVWTLAAIVVCISCILLGVVWIVMRQSERDYYKSLHKQRRWTKCPVCNYSFEGLGQVGADPERCPECGQNMTKLRHEAEIVAES